MTAEPVDAGTVAGPVEWRLDLPGYTSPPLSENQRLHWAAKHRIGQQLRNDVLLLARAAKLPRNLGRVEIVWHWQPTVRRRRDDDNPTPSLKVARDALVAYGLVADDDSEHVRSGCVIEPVGAPPARCWLTITERVS